MPSFFLSSKILSTMFTVAFYLSFLLLHLFTTTATATTTPPPYNATDYILVDCGSPTTTTSEDGRHWLSDTLSNYVPPNINTISEPSETSAQKVPYKTARKFHSKFTYTFSKLSNGPKFIRLYFNPSRDSTFNTTDSFFSVMANKYTLLSNFSAYLDVEDSSVYEYIINIIDDDQQVLNITFLPSPNSFAFVNGIELVSMPDNLYYTGKDIKFVGQTTPYNIHNSTAFQTFYRLNVGGSQLPGTDDTGMFRSWIEDDLFLTGLNPGITPHRNVTVEYTSDAPAYTAPEIVYTTSRQMDYNHSLEYNMSWSFSVDSGFYYLLRLHFCEFMKEIIQEGDRMFTIFINNQTAQEEADVISWGKGLPQVAVKQDYIAYVDSPNGQRSKQHLWLAMYPDVGPYTKYKNALLNGLEVFKLSDSNGSLAAPNPPSDSTTQPSTLPESKKKSKSGSFVYPVVGSVIGGIVLFVIAFVSFLIFRRRKKGKELASAAKSSWVPLSDKSKSSKTSGSGSILPSDLCRYFSLEEIKCATSNFDDKFVIGVGGFGKVYKGSINNDANDLVAIKRLDSSSKQGVREFVTEIEMLSKLRHLHLVSLIGYCDENGEMILVYDYMSRGTLRDHLYKTENPPLSLTQRLKICIGAAKGLHYLHTSAKHTIIHRDVKSTNILLDEKWVAKVSDFGLSRIGPTNGTQTHVSTVVKGSFGYLDPEYYRRQQLTEKSDVYSFGVVLFEVLSARPAIIPSLPKEQVNLAEWARVCSRKGKVNQILDPYLKGKIAAECLEKYVEIAFSCLKDKGIERPAMNDVVWSLEFALQLQEAAEKSGSVNANASDYTESLSIPLILHREATSISSEDDDIFSRSGEASASSRTKSSGNNTINSDGIKPDTVFSEIVNPTGR